MKLNMLFIIALLFGPFQIRKAQGEECNVINQYYGSEYKGIIANNNRPSNNGLQGEPGKRGPKGARGFPGQKVSLFSCVTFFSSFTFLRASLRYYTRKLDDK